MIVTIAEDHVSVRDVHDFTRLHVESTNSHAGADAEQLAASGLGHLDEDGAVRLDSARLRRLITDTVEQDLHSRWRKMIDYAARHGWTESEDKFVRAHLERVSRTGGEAGAVPVGSSRFREVLGHFASGITVITGTTAAGPVGFSCQSFSALSLDPPMVVVLPGRSSTSWPRVQATGRFCVNVLAADQEDLCRRFARSGGDKFSGVDQSPGAFGSPRLAGACAWIECDVNAVSDGGDHLVVLGDVRALDADETRTPLLFHRGSYRKVS